MFESVLFLQFQGLKFLSDKMLLKCKQIHYKERNSTFRQIDAQFFSLNMNCSTSYTLNTSYCNNRMNEKTFSL